LFSIIPGKDLEQLGSDSLADYLAGYLKQFDKEDRELQRNIKLIAVIPKLIGGKHSNKVFNSQYRDGSTMFDFINVFTEEAHNYKDDPSQRLQIEKNAGDLADFIAKNKRSFA
jgi:hypothetical protein